MKYENLKRSLLAKQLLAQSQSNPERVVLKLLRDLSSLQAQLEELHSVVLKQPVPLATEKGLMLDCAIKSASLNMHAAFHRCHVPNAILSTVRFPDGLYKLTFQKVARESKDMN